MYKAENRHETAEAFWHMDQASPSAKTAAGVCYIYADVCCIYADSYHKHAAFLATLMVQMLPDRRWQHVILFTKTSQWWVRAHKFSMSMADFMHVACNT